MAHNCSQTQHSFFSSSSAERLCQDAAKMKSP
uniref:Uncharacterized protein n=1 Tax=Anguilla anguilla TaxID=7936 RepID=A0A0E9SEL3_ANGAN